MLGDFVRPFTFSCAVMFVATLAYAGILNNQTPYYFYFTVGGTALHLLWQYITVDLDDPESCGGELPSYSIPFTIQLMCGLLPAVNFDRNGHMGWVTWAGLMVDYLVKIDKMPFALPF